MWFKQNSRNLNENLAASHLRVQTQENNIDTVACKAEYYHQNEGYQKFYKRTSL
jgi:hypothetical protein